jgi:hypothetical protein
MEMVNRNVSPVQNRRADRLAHLLPLLAAGLVLLGLGVRFRQYLAAPSYWYDEAYLLLNVFEKNGAELMGRLRNDQAAPPVFLWTLRLLYVSAGPAEWVMRLPAFMASLLAVVVMIPLARRVVPGPGSLWAIGLCALSLHGVNHGIEVKPYAWDLLVTLLLVLAAASYFSTSGSRTVAFSMLLFLAVVAPWCSLPSVFVLGGLSAALLVDLGRQPTKRRAASWLLFNSCCLVSCAVLWYGILRHQRTSALQSYWADSFGDFSSVWGLLGWCVRCLLEIGHYGSNGLGIPLVLLAGAGVVFLGRRSPAMAVLLTVPVALAMTASLLRFYPLADRLAFFLVPCIWLLAAESIGRFAEFLYQPRRLRAVTWVGLASLLLLLAPGVGQLGKNLFVAVPRLPFRDAFEYVERQREPRDVCWVSHPEVFEVYRGKASWCLNSYSPAPEVVKQAAGRRVWLICATGPAWTGPRAELEAQLMQEGMTPLAARDFPSLVVHLYGPAPALPEATAVSQQRADSQ